MSHLTIGVRNIGLYVTIAYYSVYMLLNYNKCVILNYKMSNYKMPVLIVI